jgi:chromosome condensin MukBEF MukE localization factor
MAETKKVKITHSVDYKGTAIKAGAEVELEAHIADRLIANGHAVAITEPETKTKKTKE